MINVYFNNTLVNVPASCTLHELLMLNGVTEGCFSIAVNQQFVRRAQYLTLQLCEQDRIDLIEPMQGG
jgi:thiamine biosynthesis protein ThiS